MKKLIALCFAAVLSACSRQEHTSHETHERPPENGAQYKDREGVALTDVMKKSIGVTVAEVEDAKVAPTFTVPLHVMPASGFQKIALTATSREAAGWLTAEQARLVQPGMRVELQGNGADALAGTVARVEQAAFQISGEFEVTVEAARPLEIGSRVLATFRGASGESVTAIPTAALLKTAEGHFAYVVNGERYVRTPVKVGARSAERVEITDGLYSGDQVVVTGVTALWLAELQVLRGGKACTCGS